jgi:hypothetical protein
MIIRLQGMGFRTGDRVATKKKKPEYGNVFQAISSKLRDVKLDNGSAVAMKSQSIKKVEAQTALSPPRRMLLLRAACPVIMATWPYFTSVLYLNFKVSFQV